MLFKTLHKPHFSLQWESIVYVTIPMLLHPPQLHQFESFWKVPSPLLGFSFWLPKPWQSQQWHRGPRLSCRSRSSFCLPPAWALTYINVFWTFQIMANIIRKCLKTTEQLSFSSITFPMIGTGNLGFPKAIFAERILSEVFKYSSHEWLKTLQEVQFLVHLDDDEGCQVWLFWSFWQVNLSAIGCLCRYFNNSIFYFLAHKCWLLISVVIWLNYEVTRITHTILFRQFIKRQYNL